MPATRWALIGVVLAGSLTVGSCAGALAGNYTVTGGLYGRGGWAVPNAGAEDVTAHLPPAQAIVRVPDAPQYAGYYPAAAPIVSTPVFADTAARDFDQLYDEPVHHEAVHVDPAQQYEPVPQPADDTSPYREDAGTDADGAAD